MLTLNAIERGWFAETGAHSAQHYNTATGLAGDIGVLRAFLVFDLASLNVTVARATLRLEIEAYFSAEGSETFTVYGVTTPARAMSISYSPGAAAGQAIFEDLGTGAVYGRATVTANDVGRIVEIALTPQATADLQAASGGLFAIGIQLEPADLASAETDMLKIVRFSAAAEDRTHQLLLETSTAVVPTGVEPGTFGLHYDIPEAHVPDTLREVVATQPTTIEAMLRGVLNVVVQVEEPANPTDPQRVAYLHDLIQRTTKQLETFATNHVRVEQRIGDVLTGKTHTVALSENCVALLHALEQVNTVLHANISLARRFLNLMWERHACDGENDEDIFDSDTFEL